MSIFHELRMCSSLPNIRTSAEGFFLIRLMKDAHQTPILLNERRFIMHIKKNPSVDVLILGNEEHMRSRCIFELADHEIAKLWMQVHRTNTLSIE